MEKARMAMDASDDLLMHIMKKNGFDAACQHVWAMVGAFLIMAYRERGLIGFMTATSGLHQIIEHARKKATEQ